MIVSLYTVRTEFYLRAASRMMEDCDRLKIKHDIQTAIEAKHLAPDSKEARQFVQQQKPKFILEMLQKHRVPVWWLDVDSVVKAMPPSIASYHWFAAHHQPHKPKYEIMSSVLYFKPVREAFKFLEDWRRALLPGMSDHTPLVKVFHRWKDRPQAGWALINFHDWVHYNGFNSVEHPHPIHGERHTS